MGLYLLADLHRGEPQYAPLEAGLFAGLVVEPQERPDLPTTHRLQLSRRGKSPTEADWQALLKALPYRLLIEPRKRSHGELHVLDATYQVRTCVCGLPRAITGGILHPCLRCGSKAVYYKRDPEEVRL